MNKFNLRFLAAILFTMFNKAREYSQTIRVCPEHVLGMPLYGPDKMLAHHLHCLDDAVRSDGHRYQIIAEVFRGLVMQSIHLKDVFAQQRLQISVQRDCMRRNTVRLALSVNYLRRVLCRKVLPERTAQKHIDKLKATADAKYGLVG